MSAACSISSPTKVLLRSSGQPLWMACASAHLAGRIVVGCWKFKVGRRKFTDRSQGDQYGGASCDVQAFAEAHIESAMRRWIDFAVERIDQRDVDLSAPDARTRNFQHLLGMVDAASDRFLFAAPPLLDPVRRQVLIKRGEDALISKIDAVDESREALASELNAAIMTRWP